MLTGPSTLQCFGFWILCGAHIQLTDLLTVEMHNYHGSIVGIGTLVQRQWMPSQSTGHVKTIGGAHQCV